MENEINKNYIKQVHDLGVTIWYEEDGHRISFGEAPGNRHYEEYLLWVAEGNTAEIIED